MRYQCAGWKKTRLICWYCRRWHSRVSCTVRERVFLKLLTPLHMTGYCFTSAEDIGPFLEDASDGPTYRWAAATGTGASLSPPADADLSRSPATRLNCYVLIGVPTLSSSTSQGPCVVPAAPSPSHGEPELAPPLPKAFNSLLLLSPAGILLHTYQKHHLYETDESWATEGPGFVTWKLPFPSAEDSATFKLAPCICMDLNPYRFVAPFESYELGTFAEREGVDVVVCSMAWLDSEPPANGVDESEQEEEGEEWDKVRNTLSYWAMRCGPLMGSGAAFVGCNRAGREGGEFRRARFSEVERMQRGADHSPVRSTDVVFTGSSCVIKLEETPEVLDFAPKRGEALLRVDVPLRDRRQA